jgi:hypothetical protein
VKSCICLCLGQDISQALTAVSWPLRLPEIHLRPFLVHSGKMHRSQFRMTQIAMNLAKDWQKLSRALVGISAFCEIGAKWSFFKPNVFPMNFSV